MVVLEGEKGDGLMTGVRGGETDVNWILKVGFFK